MRRHLFDKPSASNTGHERVLPAPVQDLCCIVLPLVVLMFVLVQRVRGGASRFVRTKSQFGLGLKSGSRILIRTWTQVRKTQPGLTTKVQKSIRTKSESDSPKVNSDLALKSKSRIRSPNPKSEKSISAGAPLQQFGLQSEVRIRSPNVFKLKNETALAPPAVCTI